MPPCCARGGPGATSVRMFVISSSQGDDSTLKPRDSSRVFSVESRRFRAQPNQTRSAGAANANAQTCARSDGGGRARREVVRQLIEREKPDLAGFQPRAWCSPVYVANEEVFINVERVQRQMAMPVPVV